MFRLDSSAPNWLRRGDFGTGLPRGYANSLQLANWGLNLVMILLLAPGLVRLTRSGNGRMIAVCVVWFVVFYASVFYLGRFRIGLLPAFMIAAGAGLSGVMEAARRKSRPFLAAFAFWVIFCLLLFSITQRPLATGPFQKSHWQGGEPGTGVDQEERYLWLVNLGLNFDRAGRGDLLSSELGPYINRAGGLEQETLARAERYCARQGAGECAEFFRGLRLSRE